MSKVAIVTGAVKWNWLCNVKRLVHGSKVEYWATMLKQLKAVKSCPQKMLQSLMYQKQQKWLQLSKLLTISWALVVVNNAGAAPTTPLDTITEEQFTRTFAINVGGVIWVQ